VQRPNDARFESMPRSALEQVDIDYILPASEIATLLTTLTGRDGGGESTEPELRKRVGIEVAILESTGEMLWQVTRSLEEAVMVLDHMGRHIGERGDRERAQIFSTSPVISRSARKCSRTRRESMKASAPPTCPPSATHSRFGRRPVARGPRALRPCGVDRAPATAC
jgi:hypothetical protein